MRKSFLSFIFALLALCLHAAQKPIKVACVGNSITFGYLLDNPLSYRKCLETAML